MLLKKQTDSLPSFFLNSVPKSGTNLLMQILSGMPGISHEPADTFFHPYDFVGSFYRLGHIPHNKFGVGHIYFSEEWAYLLRRLEMKQVFIMRDLRDVVLSLSYFVVEKPEYHQMFDLYEYMTRETMTQKERLLTLINGVKTDKFEYPNLSEWFTPFTGWLVDPNTLSITFENLVGSPESCKKTVGQVADFLWEGLNPPVSISNMVQLMEANIDPLHCGTFRKGEIGNWRSEFDEEIKTAFKQVVGSTLISLGYEKDDNW